MKIETEELEHRQTKLKVEVEPALLEQFKHQAAKKLAKRTKIPGFRPGKAPYPVVVRQLGEPVILEEAIELLIDDIYPKAIENSGIEPYGPGSLDEIKSLDPPTFEFIVPLIAKIELGDYHSIRIPYELTEVTEENIESVITNLRNSNAIVEHVDRAIQEGDQVNIQLIPERIEIDGESPTSLLEENARTFIIESESKRIEQNAPFPGFTSHLIGMSAGDTKSISYTYPEDYSVESLRGVQTAFTVSVEQVNSRVLPNVDDELAQSVGDYETLDDLYKAIREQLEIQARESYHEKYDETLLDELVEMCSVEYPSQMLEREIELVLSRLNERLEQQGLDIELYLKTRGITIDELKEESKPVAENRLTRSLIFYEVANQENIQVNPQDLEAETLRTMELYSQLIPEQDFRKMASDKESTSNLVSNIMMEMVNNRTRDKLRNIARGIDAQSSQSNDEKLTTESKDMDDPVLGDEERADVASLTETDKSTSIDDLNTE